MLELIQLGPERVPAEEPVAIVYLVDIKNKARIIDFVSQSELAQTFPMLPKEDSPLTHDQAILGTKDPYLSIQVSDTYKQAVADMITTLANTSLPGLAFKRPYLKRKGEEISSHHVHTLKFLECLLYTPELRSSLRKVRSSSLKWNGLLWGEGGRERGDGMGGALDALAQGDRLNAYLPGFVKSLHAKGLQVDLQILQTFTKTRDWQGMLDYLMRSGS